MPEERRPVDRVLTSCQDASRDVTMWTNGASITSFVALLVLLGRADDTLDTRQQFQEVTLRFAGPKLHKTASTTLGAMLARLANKYGLDADLYGGFDPMTPPQEAAKRRARSGGAVEFDILYSHPRGSGRWGSSSSPFLAGKPGVPWPAEATPYSFQQLIGYLRARVPESRLLVVLREPASRFVSHLNFFHRPASVDRLVTLVHTRVEAGAGGNYQAETLGLHSAQDVEDFLAGEDFAQAVVLTTDQLEEGLVATMRHQLGWDMDDILFLDLHDSCVDQNVVCAVDGLTALDRHTKQQLDELHDLDWMLYRAAKNRTACDFAALGKQGRREKAELERRKEALSPCLALRRNASSSSFRPSREEIVAHPCLPFLVNDAVYGIIPGKGTRRAPVYRFDGDGRRSRMLQRQRRLRGAAPKNLSRVVDAPN